MLLRYTGPKPEKRVEVSGMLYLFTPTCEVFDKEAIRFFLKADMRGLFVMATPDVPEPPKVEPQVDEAPTTAVPKKKRTRKKKE